MMSNRDFCICIAILLLTGPACLVISAWTPSTDWLRVVCFGVTLGTGMVLGFKSGQDNARQHLEQKKRVEP